MEFFPCFFRWIHGSHSQGSDDRHAECLQLATVVTGQIYESCVFGCDIGVNTLTTNHSPRLRKMPEDADYLAIWLILKKRDMLVCQSSLRGSSGDCLGPI